MASNPAIVFYPEKVTIYSGAWTPDTGTETLSSVAVTLYDNQWAVAGGISSLAATGFDNLASAAPTAWFDFDPVARTVSQPTPATGQAIYTLRFVATDSNGKRYASDVLLVLKP